MERTAAHRAAGRAGSIASFGSSLAAGGRIRPGPGIDLYWPVMSDSQYNRGNLAETLRGHGINPTHQRIEIAHALFSRREHLSADQVMAIVNERHSETSKATVYNTLNLFLEKKLIREVIVDPNKVFYDPNTEPHHHMYDLQSG